MTYVSFEKAALNLHSPNTCVFVCMGPVKNMNGMCPVSWMCTSITYSRVLGLKAVIKKKLWLEFARWETETGTIQLLVFLTEHKWVFVPEKWCDLRDRNVVGSLSGLVGHWMEEEFLFQLSKLQQGQRWMLIDSFVRNQFVISQQSVLKVGSNIYVLFLQLFLWRCRLLAIWVFY